MILFNGQGGEYHGVLNENGQIHLESFEKTDRASPICIHLLQAISKGDRMDYAIQKAIELGVSSITPVISRYSAGQLNAERMEKKRRHWQGIINSACEQCGLNLIPTLHAATKLTQYQGPNHLKLFFDPQGETSINTLETPAELTVAIGPEGGWSQEDIDHLKTQGFLSVPLGQRILRTETATVAVLAMAGLLWGDLAN